LGTTSRSGVSIVIIVCALIGACTRQSTPVGPKFSGRLLLLAGDSANGADLVELTQAPTGLTYNVSTLASGVFEATGSPDQTQLLYATRDEVLLRDLRNGAVKSLIKGESYCLAWSPDGKRFTYKQKSSSEGKADGSAASGPTKLFVSDLDGKAKLLWEDSGRNEAATGPAPASNRAGATSYCAYWIAPDRLVFDRFAGASLKQNAAADALKPNTTTIATISDTVKLHDTERKWSIESICYAENNGFVRPRDQAQPILVAKFFDHFETLDPSPLSCSDCRFVGYAAQSCVPFFVQQNTSISTDLFSLNPTNWQRQRVTSINQTFSPDAKMLIKSSARLMIVGDDPASLLLIDTETGEITPFFRRGAGPPGSNGELLHPRPVVWIEK